MDQLSLLIPIEQYAYPKLFLTKQL